MTGDRDESDPRVDGERIRTVPGDAGDVTLVGVVHDHPASVHRVRRVVADRDPDVLGLELPPLAVPLPAAHADRAAPTGEMSAAIRAAETDDVVGVDGPTLGFLRHLAATLARESASARTVGRTLREFGTVVRTAVCCRVAAAVTARTAFSVEHDTGPAHETTAADPPARQADDERRQIRRANAILGAIEAPAASRCRSVARERHMADRLDALRRRGDVVAVVGVGHLDAVADRLTRSG